MRIKNICENRIATWMGTLLPPMVAVPKPSGPLTGGMPKTCRPSLRYRTTNPSGGTFRRRVPTDDVLEPDLVGIRADLNLCPFDITSLHSTGP